MILSLNFSPLLVGRTNLLYPLMILNAERNVVECLLAESYINCFFDNNYFDIYEQDYFFTNKKIFFKETIVENFKSIMKNKKLVIQFMVERLKNHYVIIGYWNENIVNDLMDTCVRDFIIYGYEEKNKTFYIVSKNEKNVNYYSVSEALLFNALCIHDGGEIWFDLYKQNAEPNIVINKEKIYLDYKDFVSSTNRNNIFDDGKNYGISYINNYVEWIKTTCIAERHFVDYDDLLSMLNHKKITRIRISYLKSIGLLNSNNIKSDYNKVEQGFNEVNEEYLKYLESNDINYAINMVDKLLFAGEQELLFSIKMMDILSS